ncbi:MAG: DUF928 domain-containing protein [Symploca sp. SIO2E9]|nr:DUF928 domain-containing protein [Symploca sp. SIO2E9]
MKIILNLFIFFVRLVTEIYFEIISANPAIDIDSMIDNKTFEKKINFILYSQQSLIFQPRARGEDEEYSGRQKAAGDFGPKKCLHQNPNLTAFVPGQGQKSFRAMTGEQYPTFWFYVPYLSDSKLSAHFKLMFDETAEIVYEDNKIELFTTSPGGIVRIQLPQNKGLKFNKNYYWSFTIICDERERDSDIYVDGYVARVQARTEFESSENAGAEQKAIRYAKDGLWNETISTLINELCPRDSQKAKDRIIELLQSEYVGLASSAEKYVYTILQECQNLGN